MKNFIEKYPEIAKIFYKHARNSGDYIPDYKYEEVAKDLTELFDGKMKANPVENRVSQAASQAMPEPNASCENCKQYRPYDEGLGECKWFSNKTKVDYIFTAKDFFCKQFEQK